MYIAVPSSLGIEEIFRKEHQIRGIARDIGRAITKSLKPRSRGITIRRDAFLYEKKKKSTAKILYEQDKTVRFNKHNKIQFIYNLFSNLFSIAKLSFLFFFSRITIFLVRRIISRIRRELKKQHLDIAYLLSRKFFALCRLLFTTIRKILNHETIHFSNLWANENRYKTYMHTRRISFNEYERRWRRN